MPDQAEEGAMTGNDKVFISHAYQDNEACQPLLTALSSWDVDYWFQEERAEVDETLAPQVEQAIAERDIFLRVLSRTAQASYWVRLEGETFQRLRAEERQAEERREELMADAPTDALPRTQSDTESRVESYAPDKAGSSAHSGSAKGDDQKAFQDGLQDTAQDEPESDPQDTLSSGVSDHLTGDSAHELTGNKDNLQAGETPARVSKRIFIDLSLDGTVAGDASEAEADSKDTYIDMTRSHGFEWREQLRQALGLVEPGTQTSEVPAVIGNVASEALGLMRLEANGRAALAEADDRVVSVALADRPAEAGASSIHGVCLVMVQGNNVGRTYPLLLGRITLGRRRDSDIFLEDVTVSRQHAALVRDSNGRFVLYDEGSKNGTFVNGEPISERVLEDGDSIRMGQIVLRFRLPRRHD
jgi:hypothetical protein